MTNCPICNKISGKEKSFLVYEDSHVIAFLKEKPSVKGHVIIAPIRHFNIFEEVPDDLIEHVFGIANAVSRILFETFEAQGTNIIIENGVSAGQTEPHFTVNVIPRFKDDNLGLTWTGKQASETELKEAENKIFNGLNKKEEIKKKEEEKPKENKEENANEEESYFSKHLRRLP